VEGAGEDSGRTKGKGVTVGENEEHCNIEGTGVPSMVGVYEYFNSVGAGVPSGEDKLLMTLLFNELKGVRGN